MNTHEHVTVKKPTCTNNLYLAIGAFHHITSSQMKPHS